MNPELPQAGLVLDPILPLPVVALIATLLAAVTAVIYWRTGRVIARRQNVWLLLFRLLGLVLVEVVALLHLPLVDLALDVALGDVWQLELVGHPDDLPCYLAV